LYCHSRCFEMELGLVHLAQQLFVISTTLHVYCVLKGTTVPRPQPPHTPHFGVEPVSVEVAAAP
jgi:hypothetical protein